MLQWVFVHIRRATARLMREEEDFCRNYISACPDLQPLYQTNQERMDNGEDCLFLKPVDHVCVVKYKAIWAHSHDIRMFQSKQGSYALAVHMDYNTAGMNLVLNVGPPKYIQGSHGMVEFSVYTLAGTVVGTHRYHVTESVTMAYK